jgi:hypothetical protein
MRAWYAEGMPLIETGRRVAGSAMPLMFNARGLALPG